MDDISNNERKCIPFRFLLDLKTSQLCFFVAPKGTTLISCGVLYNESFFDPGEIILASHLLVCESKQWRETLRVSESSTPDFFLRHHVHQCSRHGKRLLLFPMRIT